MVAAAHSWSAPAPSIPAWMDPDLAECYGLHDGFVFLDARAMGSASDDVGLELLPVRRFGEATRELATLHAHVSEHARKSGFGPELDTSSAREFLERIVVLGRAGSSSVFFDAAANDIRYGLIDSELVASLAFSGEDVEASWSTFDAFLGWFVADPVAILGSSWRYVDLNGAQNCLEGLVRDGA